MTLLLVILLTYLCGSIPTGVLIARKMNIDIRQVGSGNVGATNVARSVGKKAGLFTLLGDVLKGLLPVIIVRILDFGETAVACAAVSAIVGHMFSPFLHFSGGKGVATGLGVFLGFAPLALLLALVPFLLTFAASRIVSLASLVSTLIAPILLWWFSYAPAYIYAGWLIAILISLRHRENIVRLLHGTEPKFHAADSSTNVAQKGSAA
ncbi:MAG: glycerol-3-phosphate 1-O-acyltransferase PlsY [Candidatus Binatia bacterium]